MDSPAAPLHAAVEAALRASPDLPIAMGLPTARLYVQVPANAPLPYVVAGQLDVQLEDHGDCPAEAEVTSTVTFWSRPSPLDHGAQARAIGAAVIAALLVQLTVPGWDVDEWELQLEKYSTNPDQSCRGVVEIRYLLTQQV